MQELNESQIRDFLDAQGVTNTRHFLEAVERANAWAFCARPQDLEELAEIWLDTGTLGSRIDLIKNSIRRRLGERDPNRDDSRPLPLEQAYQGARILAAASTLLREPSLAVPSHGTSPAGIAVSELLPTWGSADITTLLQRPIFEPGIYGTVRFHHRSVKEFLVAEWFTDLLETNTSRFKIEALFFKEQYGEKVVAPELRSTLPWLVALDVGVLERVREWAPQVILEGGDPRQLPLETRRSILAEVCAVIAKAGPTSELAGDHAAVQRFADPDLAQDVAQLLGKYCENKELVVFLSRMVWLGDMKSNRNVVRDLASNRTEATRVRVASTRALRTVGTDKDLAELRTLIATEPGAPPRDLVAELLSDAEPHEELVNWLLDCIEKSATRAKRGPDRLELAIRQFVSNVDERFLPSLVKGFDTLLARPPVIEKRYCEVSKAFLWLLEPASLALERLIGVRHESVLGLHALSILHRCKLSQAYDSYPSSQVKLDFPKLVQAWPELNRKLFWFEVESARSSLAANDRRLTTHWEAATYGSFWGFGEHDFGFFAEQVANQTLEDNRLVALSAAFELYRNNRRPRAWREKLRRICASDGELSSQLGRYLRPPAASPEVKRTRRQTRRWRQQSAQREKRQEKERAKARKYLQDNLPEIERRQKSDPGSLRNPIAYLYDKARGDTNGLKYSEGDWRELIPEYGENLARFYRESVTRFWRHHDPQLRSEGASLNQTSLYCIVGLVGLQIEAGEVDEWPETLAPRDAERACKYASFEINGFPSWLPDLFKAHPNLVGRFFLKEISFELDIETADTDTHYVLGDASWSGEWLRDEIAPDLVRIVGSRQIRNPQNLKYLLTILQSSNVSDQTLEELASSKARAEPDVRLLSQWLAVWMGVAPEQAMAHLKERIGALEAGEQEQLAMRFVTHLCGTSRRDRPGARQAYRTSVILKDLYLFLLDYIRPEADINRAGGGAYSPELRDDAQEARESLLSSLADVPQKEGYLALLEVARRHPNKSARPWIGRRARLRAESDADGGPWSLRQVLEFQTVFERAPENHRQLAEAIELHLLDLKKDLEDGDSSISSILRRVKNETELRKYVGGELRKLSRGRYTIPQEEELADAKRPDLRAHGIGFDAPVPVELKIAEKWTGPKLFERMENQLCRDYLRDLRSRRGFFVLVYLGIKNRTSWDLPDNSKTDFAGLISALSQAWSRLSPNYPEIDDIVVLGIDLTKRDRAER